ncbi:hypothetical protein E6U81_27570, partial [Streptomyces sp. A0592]
MLGRPGRVRAGAAGRAAGRGDGRGAGGARGRRRGGRGRAALREQGLIPRPLPQIRMVRWLRAPRETFGAWSLMLLEGVR